MQYRNERQTPSQCLEIHCSIWFTHGHDGYGNIIRPALSFIVMAVITSDAHVVTDYPYFSFTVHQLLLVTLSNVSRLKFRWLALDLIMVHDERQQLGCHESRRIPSNAIKNNKKWYARNRHAAFGADGGMARWQIQRNMTNHFDRWRVFSIFLCRWMPRRGQKVTN